MRMPDTQDAEDFQLERAGVAQLLALRSPSDKSLVMIIGLFILMLVIQSFKDSIGELTIILTVLIVSTALLILSADFSICTIICIRTSLDSS